MSETVPVPPAQKLPVVTATDSLRTPQFIIGYTAVWIVAATVAAVFWRGNEASINVALGFVFGSLGASPLAFYFGASKGSQMKDEAAIAKGTTSP